MHSQQTQAVYRYFGLLNVFLLTCNLYIPTYLSCPPPGRCVIYVSTFVIHPILLQMHIQGLLYILNVGINCINHCISPCDFAAAYVRVSLYILTFYSVVLLFYALCKPINIKYLWAAMHFTSAMLRQTNL